MSASEDTNRRPPAMPTARSTERPTAVPHVGSSSQDESRAQERANDDDEDEWRHEPIAPVDERNPLKSLGRAVADVATGGSPDASKPRDR